MDKGGEGVDEAAAGISSVDPRRALGLAFRSNLVAMLGTVASFRNDITDVELETTSAAGMSEQFGFEDVLISFVVKDSGRTMCSAILMVREQEATSEDERLDTSPRSPVDSRLLAKYFKYYRTLTGSSARFRRFRNLDDIIVYWHRREDGAVFEKSVVFPKEVLTDLPYLDPVFESWVLRLREDFEGRKDLVLQMKDEWVPLPRDVARVVVGERTNLHGVQIPRRDDDELHRSYADVFSDEGFDRKLGRLNPNFVEGKGLSPTMQHYRDAAEATFGSSDKRLLPRDSTTFVEFLAMAQVGRGSCQKRPPRTRKEGFFWKLGLKLADVLSRRRDGDSELSIRKEDAFLRKNVGVLLGFVLVEMGDGFAFRREFLSDGWLPERFDVFRNYLRAQVRAWGTTMGALERYRFRMEGHDHDKSLTKYCGDLVEVRVRDFLAKVKFVTICPGAEQMEDLCVKEMAKHVGTPDAGAVQGAVVGMTQKLLDEGQEGLGLKGNVIETCVNFLLFLRRHFPPAPSTPSEGNDN